MWPSLSVRTDSKVPDVLCPHVIGELKFKWARLTLNWRAASAFTGRLRWVAREMLNRRQTAAYAIKGTDLTAVIRHPMVDAQIAHEVFHLTEYAIPDEVRQRLPEPARVLDLGGNVGLFALYALREIPCRIVSFEPDPRNAAVLHRCIAENPSIEWELVQAAAGVEDREVEFISDFGLAQLETVAADFGGHTRHDTWLPPSLRAAHPPTMTATVRLVDVMPWLTGCDLLKIDIEGAEWAILTDPRFAQTSAVAIVMEVHARPGEAPAAAARLDEALAATPFTLLRPWDVSRDADILWAVRR
jgi:FkbM family methyltransferase